jgi:hypothetical protein
MKNVRFILVSMMALAIFSCAEQAKESEDLIHELEVLKSKTILNSKTVSSPVSDMDITPYLIPGANRGGNRTCAEVGYAFTGDENYFALCGEKIDYNADDNFGNKFPTGLNVTVEGNFISFESNGCLEIGGNTYMVGAVIVKGSNQANIYFYPNGTYSDSGLAAPINRSGKSAALSNLTFCFIECEKSELVVALKTTLTMPDVYSWSYAESGGLYFPNQTSGVAYNYYTPGSEHIFPLNFGFGPYHQIGTITVNDFMENGIHYLEVIIDTEDDAWIFLKSYLYVGSLLGLEQYLVEYPGNSFLRYDLFPFIEDGYSDIRTYKIPFEDITE